MIHIRTPDNTYPNKGQTMHAYRTHTCGELRAENAGTEARISGWVHRKRDHGNLLFVDLRDHYGLTQCVIDSESEIFSQIEGLRLETVICVTGRVEERTDDTKNADLPTGAVELRIDACEVLGTTEPLPLEVNSDRQGPSEHHSAQLGHIQHSPADDRPGLHGVPDPDPDIDLPGRRAGLSRA
jgi:aspartyl-tRNA synthetase